MNPGRTTPELCFCLFGYPTHQQLQGRLLQVLRLALRSTTTRNRLDNVSLEQISLVVTFCD